jgi:hypothetical protein
MSISSKVRERLEQTDTGGNGNGNPWEGLLAVAQAFYRWQNTYSPAGTLEQEFFACALPDLCTVHRDYPAHQHYLLQHALPACLTGWEQRVTASFRSEEAGSLPLRRLVMPSGPGTWGTALDDARLGFVSPEGEKVMARVSLCMHASGPTEVACLTLIGPATRATFLSDLLTDIEAWMAAHPHLRGAKLDAKGEFLTLDRAYTWDDIVFATSVRAEVDTHVLKFVARLPQYQALGLPTKRGILLVGPPGTGKTLLGKVLCSVLPTTFLWVSPGQLGDAAHLRWLFNLARELQPTILFLEDLDLYASRRTGGDVALGELLNQLDGFPENRGLLTIATTNDLHAIEPALADRPSRFDRLIRLEAPKTPERLVLLARFLRPFPHPTDCLPELAAGSDGLTGAHLQEVVYLAVQTALDGQDLGASAPPSLTAEMLRDALRLVRRQRPGEVGFYA